MSSYVDRLIVEAVRVVGRGMVKEAAKPDSTKFSKVTRLVQYESKPNPFLNFVEQAFKKEIESKVTSIDNNPVAGAEFLNAEWKKFIPTLEKLFESKILANIKEYKEDPENFVWSLPTAANFVYKESHGVYWSSNFVINISFPDDVDAGKYKKKFGGWVNSAIVGANKVYNGTKSDFGDNNLEIPGRMLEYVLR
jgi:hypothetical protein